MEVFETVWKILAVGFILLLIGGITFSYIANQNCRNECIDRGTRFYELLPNGKWFSLEDMCVCHFNDGTEEKFVMVATGEGGEK